MYILTFNVNEQLMLALHETCEVKQTARLCLHGRLVSVTQPGQWSQNTWVSILSGHHYSIITQNLPLQLY